MATMSSITPIARFFTDITASASIRVDITPNVNITGRKMKDSLFRAGLPNVRPTSTSKDKYIFTLEHIYTNKN